MRLFLVRHGVTDWNLDHRCQGQSDVPLSSSGREQARRLAVRLRGTPFEAAYSSDLSRASETARLVLDGRQGGPALQMDFGAWEGVKVTDIVAERAEERAQWLARPDTWRPPGGECLADVQARVGVALDEIVAAHRSSTVLVVSHGFALLSWVAAAIGLPLTGFRHLWIDPTGVTEVRMGSGRTTLRRLNDTAHLEDATAPD